MKLLVLLLLSAAIVFGKDKPDPTPIEPPSSSKPSPVEAIPASVDRHRLHEFSGDEIGTVLRALAQTASMNVVIGTSVKGTMNIRIEGKTAKEVIHIICEANDLTIHELKGVFYIQRWDEPVKKDADRIAHVVKLQFDAYMEKGFTRPEALELVHKMPERIRVPARAGTTPPSEAKRSSK